MGFAHSADASEPSAPIGEGFAFFICHLTFKVRCGEFYLKPSNFRDPSSDKLTFAYEVTICYLVMKYYYIGEAYIEVIYTR